MLAYKNITFERLAISDLILLQHKPFKDNRGFFFESYQKYFFNHILGKEVNFVQDNYSRSFRGVLRGLHYQLAPHAQGKLIHVIQGEIYDVAVDIRKSSPTFGKHVGRVLSSYNHEQLWIPEGFAHGFIVLSEMADILYKTTDFYNKNSERLINWNDPILDINWHFIDKKILVPRDADAPMLSKEACFD
jgi:dTDP-4-dehydrorhamnose 3,5-epimerase